jgi:hypothetical protein
MEVKQRKGAKPPPPQGAKKDGPKTDAAKKLAKSSGPSCFARLQFWGGILFFSCILTYHLTSYYYTGNFKWRYDDVLGPTITLADSVRSSTSIFRTFTHAFCRQAHLESEIFDYFSCILIQRAVNSKTRLFVVRLINFDIYS